MRYVTATVGAVVIFVAVFALWLLSTDVIFLQLLLPGDSLERFKRDGVVDLLRRHTLGVLVAALCAALSFAGTLRYYWKRDLQAETRESEGPTNRIE